MLPITLIEGLFIGQPAPLPGDGRPTSLYRHRVTEPVRVDVEGLQDDAPADLRVHGGPDRALCHYPAEHYSYWRTQLKGPTEPFSAGGFGENLSSSGLTEAEVAIGDVFRAGTAVIQVSQPRMPCWKIGARFGLEQLPRLVAETGRSGWLYRVLQPGELGAGDRLECLERPSRPLTVTKLWETHHQLRPPLEELAELAELDTLALSWRKRFQSRLDWLSKNRR